jgi:hypothetical protein
MAKKQTNKSVINEEDQLQWCKDFLHERGYGTFKLEENVEIEEAEILRKLEMSGYKIEHIRDSLVKVDPNKILTADDIALYFYEKLRRSGSKSFDSDKLKDPKFRKVDCSIINNFIKWRMGSSVPIRNAIEELFVAIDILMDKKDEWKLDINSIGILSVTTNKPFVLSLLNNVHIEQDKRIGYQVEQLLIYEDQHSYLSMLAESKRQMLEAQEFNGRRRRRKKIKLGVENGKKESM